MVSNKTNDFLITIHFQEYWDNKKILNFIFLLSLCSTFMSCIPHILPAWTGEIFKQFFRCLLSMMRYIGITCEFAPWIALKIYPAKLPLCVEHKTSVERINAEFVLHLSAYDVERLLSCLWQVNAKCKTLFVNELGNYDPRTWSNRGGVDESRIHQK